MATKKKMLQAAAGSATGGAGGGPLDITDVFSTYLYEGNGGSQTIQNGINLGQSLGSGSVEFDGTDASGLEFADDTALQFGTGDYCLECWIWARSLTNVFGGIIAKRDTSAGFFRLTYFNSTGQISYTDGGDTVSFNFSTTGQWVHLAVTRSGTTLRIFKDGVQQSSGTSSADVSYVGKPLRIGALTGDNSSYAWDGYIASVRAVKGDAVYTSNFTPSTAPLTEITGTELLTAQGDTPLIDTSSNGFTPSVTGAAAATFGPFDAAEAGEGGLVWIKERTGTRWHVLTDSVRGVGSSLFSNDTRAEELYSHVTSLNSNGFGVQGVEVNGSGQDIASWTFRKAPKFFDVVTYSGTGSPQNISHNLGTTVGSIFVKRTDSAASWAVYHRLMYEGAGAGTIMFLNDTYNSQSSYTYWNATEPTDSQFTVGIDALTNASGGTYVAYLFAHNDGDGEFGPDGDQDIIKCGSYTGNGSTNGPEIDLGFEPQWLLIKNASNGSQWRLHDIMRGMPVGSEDISLEANLSNAEDTDVNTDNIALSPTGFKIVTTRGDWNNNGNTIIYIAIRRGPLAQPESAAEVFDIADMSSFVNTHKVNITPDAALLTFITSDYDDGTNAYPEMFDRLRGKGGLQTPNSRAENTGRTGAWDYMDRFTGVYGTGAYMWKRAPGFCDVVAYSGDAVAGRTVSHNLGVAPEMIWVKKRNAARSWIAYHSGIGSGKFLELDNTSAAGTASTVWYDTDPTATDFTVGTNSSVNQVPDTYIAYLFASLDGISKLGSFSHATGTPTNVDCGFTAGARFVLWKKTNNTDGWQVYDTTRGINSGNEPFLQLNSATADITGEDLIDPLSTGFTVSANKNSGDYIFYAIA